MASSKKKSSKTSSKPAVIAKKAPALKSAKPLKKTSKKSAKAA